MISTISVVRSAAGPLKHQVSHVSVRTMRRYANARLVWASVAGLVLISSAASAQPARTPTDPTGEWLVAKQVARIKIADCDGRLWGVVAWEAQPGGIDKKNPDPNLRSRPTLGMPILLGMTPSKGNRWDGQIYNSEDGHTYSANISSGGSQYSARAGLFSWISMRRRKLDAVRNTRRNRLDATHTGKAACPSKDGSRPARADRGRLLKDACFDGVFP